MESLKIWSLILQEGSTKEMCLQQEMLQLGKVLAISRPSLELSWLIPTGENTGQLRLSQQFTLL